MLTTLLKIGEWQSKGKDEWDRFLNYPKVEFKDKFENELSNYVLDLIFDLDEMEVLISKNNIKEYDTSDILKLKVLKIKGGNNKATYATVPAGKIIQLYKTFFGKEGEDCVKGELYEAIEKSGKSSMNQNFLELLNEIFQLKRQFFELISETKEKSNNPEINIKSIEERIETGKFERLILLTTKVKSIKYGYQNPINFVEIPEFLTFISSQLFGGKSEEKKAEKKRIKLCYASGEMANDVKELNLSSRYSLNKMFVTETKNYASRFSDKNFYLNYQVSSFNQEKLDYASDFLLNQGYKVRIANLDHVIIPQFLYKTEIDFELVFTGIKNKSDLLFRFDTLDNLSKEISVETDDVFWINFVAFESDGNFFKSTEIIKDVSSFHFSKVLKTLSDIDWDFRASCFVDWNSVMTEYGIQNGFFNFNTVYSIIPLRKDKEKKNKALDLIKSVLENRMIKPEIIYNYFTELILCHWFERYGSYTNVNKSSKDYFSKTVRDSVFKYHALIQLLKNLNLINMEEIKGNLKEGQINIYDKAIQGFIEQMALNPNQQAMFYLGRLLNIVEYIQKDKKKTVIHKVNFNGMDKDDIQRLRLGLIEKAKQYNAMVKVIFIDRKFSENFDFNNWKMSPQEAVFFLLTGYSFSIGKKESQELEEIEND